LTIGRFADATGLTVKALRHYDEIGLLVPARVDPENGYRYYDAAQVEDAVTIRRLRALELPLDEIGALLEADGDLLRDRLAAHGYRVAEEVRDKHSLLIELSALVEGGGAQVVVEVRDVPGLQLAAMIRHLRLVDPEGVTGMPRLAWDRLAGRGIAPAGPPTALFRSGDGNGTHLVEAGAGPSRHPESGLERLRVRQSAGMSPDLRLLTNPAPAARVERDEDACLVAVRQSAPWRHPHASLATG
jgi:DNA-binding transcriptional MerR regulator